MSSAFVPIVRTRPCPIFGRPVHQGSLPFDYSPILLLKPFGFRIAPDTLSSGIRRATGSRSVLAVSGFRLRARLDFSIPSCSPGQRGITPAFGYSAPHPSAEGTSTPMIHALPSAHYAVPKNSRALSAFRHYVTDLWRRTLRRRSQKDGFTWKRMTKLVADWLPPPRILHPWPDDRFAVRHPR